MLKNIYAEKNNTLIRCIIIFFIMLLKLPDIFVFNYFGIDLYSLVGFHWYSSEWFKTHNGTVSFKVRTKSHHLIQKSLICEQKVWQ